MTDIPREPFLYHSDLPGADPVRLLPDDEYVLESSGLPQDEFGQRHAGKVRDVYDQGDRLLLVATDRFSSFDRQLAVVPHSGAAVTAVSQFWFEQTADIVDNHMLDVPDPNVMVVAKYEVLPVEVIVRGFMTGVTSTSLWTAYQAGQRVFGDRRLPDNLHKNDELPGGPLVSATTKFEDHDRPLTDEEVVELPGMDRRTWHEIKEKSLALYGLGRRIAAEHNLIIVDTKYEYGRGPRESVLLDEVHTSDSSRYWLNDDYAHRHEYFEEPAYLDKEYVRSWMKGRCDPYADEELPAVPDYIIAEMGRRYLRVYEKLLGQPYQPDFSLPVQERLRQNLSGYRTSHA